MHVSNIIFVNKFHKQEIFHLRSSIILSEIMKNIVVNVILIIISFLYFCFISVYNFVISITGIGDPHVLNSLDVVLNIIGVLLIMLIGFIFAQISGEVEE